MISGKRGLAAAALAALLSAPAALASIPSAADLALAPRALPELAPASIEATAEPESCGAFCQRLDVRLEAGLFGGVAPDLLALDAWGNYRNPDELDASKNRFGFTGHLFDRETRTYYAKARYLDPTLGRFLSQDSYLGEIDNPPSIHRYAWAHNRPTYFVDPTGNVVETAWDVFSLGLGLKSLRDSLSEGRIADAALDTLGIVADTAAVIVPGVPGGAGAAIRGARGGKKLVDTLQAVDAAANATQAAGAAVEAIHEGKAGRAALNAGMAVLGVGNASRPARRVADEASDVGDVARTTRHSSDAGSLPSAGGLPGHKPGGFAAYAENPRVLEAEANAAVRAGNEAAARLAGLSVESLAIIKSMRRHTERLVRGEASASNPFVARRVRVIQRAIGNKQYHHAGERFHRMNFDLALEARAKGFLRDVSIDHTLRTPGGFRPSRRPDYSLGVGTYPDLKPWRNSPNAFDRTEQFVDILGNTGVLPFPLYYRIW